MDEWQAGSKLLIEQGGEALGYEVRTLNANNVASEQANQMDTAISQHPKAIIVAAVDSSTIIPSVEEAKAAGIPVVVYDREITGTKVDFTSVTGTQKMGQIAADQIGPLLIKKYGTARGTVLEVMGDLGDSYTVGIDQGFRAEMTKDFPNVNVIVKNSPGWTAEAAADAVDSQLTTNKNIDIIFLHSEVRAPAVITVLQAHNLKAGDITLVGTDGTPTGLAAIRDGWMLETVQQPVPQQVAGIWQYMSDVLAKKTFSPGSVDIGGLTSELTLESWGPTLTLPGGVIDATNVNDPSLWGNLKVIVGS